MCSLCTICTASTHAFVIVIIVLIVLRADFLKIAICILALRRKRWIQVACRHILGHATFDGSILRDGIQDRNGFKNAIVVDADVEVRPGRLAVDVHLGEQFQMH